ncbi:MAG: CHAD domain-containing protein [Myxococcaceae bacterium]
MARINPAPQLDRLEEALTRARAGDVEGLHQVRVVARRLLVWLELAEARTLRDDLKWLLRETSALRDLDVFDALLTPEGRAALRPAAEKRARAALTSPRTRALVAAFRALGTVRRRRANRVLAELERALGHSRFEETDDQLHALRKLVRRVRYAREWLGLDAEPVRALQDALGAVCDVIALQRLTLSRGA